MSAQDLYNIIASALIVGAVAFAARWIWSHVKAHIDEGRALLYAKLDAIDDRLATLNGAVLRHEKRFDEQNHRIEKLEWEQEQQKRP